MIKAAFFDVDGTLLSHKTGGVPASAVRAIKQLQAKGVLCALATGRHATELDELPDLGVDFDAKLLLSGQICVLGDGSPVFDVPLSAELTAGLVAAFERGEFALQLVEYERCYINYVNERVKRVFAEISSPVPALGSYEGAKLYMGVGIVNEDEERKLVEDLPPCHPTRWHEGAIDIVEPSFNKAKAIAMFCERWGIAQEETLAFGDSENDREMLSWCGIGVAMGNADTTTQAVANYVASDIDDDGVARALKDLALIEL